MFAVGYAWNELRRRWSRTVVTAIGTSGGAAEAEGAGAVGIGAAVAAADAGGAAATATGSLVCTASGAGGSVSAVQPAVAAPVNESARVIAKAW